MELKNKTVIITGASSGIGRACAQKFAGKGCKLALAARRIDRLNDLRKELGECICVKTDVRKEEDVIHLFNQAEKAFGRIDILVNNAGIGLKSELCDIDVEDWDRVFDVNVKGVFLCTREAAKRMDKGHVITVSSIAGLFGAPTYAAYCASKHAVTGFKRSLKWELKKIKISIVHPFRVHTEFFKDYAKKPKKWQMLSPEDIADVIVAMAERNLVKVMGFRMRNLLKRIIGLVIR